MSDLQPFDPAEALERLDGDGELLREVVGLAHDEWLRQSEALESALRQANAPAVAVAAHSLKGAVSQLSSAGLAAGAAQVERAARSGDLTAAEASWRNTAPQIEVLIAAVREWAGGGNR